MRKKMSAERRLYQSMVLRCRRYPSTRRVRAGEAKTQFEYTNHSTERKTHEVLHRHTRQKQG
jgi:hypothetical protein